MSVFPLPHLRTENRPITKHETTPLSRLLTVKEVADYLRIDPKSVRRLSNGTKLAAYRVGRQWRITGDQLAQFLREKCR